MVKILIIEDELAIANFLQQGLEEEQYHVIIANDGLEGLALFKQENPHLVLLDWMLPKMLGLDVCNAIRLINHDIPIIFLTAKDTLSETIDGLKAGANDYIKKPFSFEELLLRIKIQLKNVDFDTKLTLGNIEIDLKEYRVFNNKIEVLLTQKEFSLLAYLIKNKGKVCTRAQIIEDVWDIHFDYDSGVIDVFINAIRKKLNLKKDLDYIKTIRGIGYIANEIS
ncbi:DNA-binding response regulator [Flavobacterium branchiophilum NBRC 15030 = ATCC 35035]|uniref:Two-component system response regulatory protein n=2 Tax=Flavobacterium branchiophilum TaxID=55197 RepID=G2Z247_FLABF|nr:response regulator transcription factor [Flavobacterium branchiophilum]OXA76741.1 DNA-binding response regulator [Flavobacterium branchiophilum NBRC 15030 = ATCC 35035]TQM39244.1 DNA-binding response OmpR family regulator [Flavobacterium branchiophilum]GEM54120.1 DNA-binding response regulator [Flavobacterium branchiophilum NBRC 15030 = ATCC 35035]CCB69999.1 Two-component system response regulatory protein [Flavobacterium branchiophilum FL-15]